MSDERVKSRTLWPMPGGTGSYLTSLHLILGMVAVTTDTAEVLGAILGRFERVNSHKAARSYLYVVATLKLVEVDGRSVRLTSSGRQYLDVEDPTIVSKALFEHVDGVCELVAEMKRRPARIGVLHEALRLQGFGWTTQSQVRYRLRWLEETYLVRRRGLARPEYSLR